MQTLSETNVVITDPSILQQVNYKIKTHCGHSYFSVKYEHDTRALVPDGITLYYKNKKVSDISWEFKILENGTGVEIEIVSMTPPQYRDRKYNKILRACTIILAPYILYDNKPVLLISSHATISLSVHSLLEFGFTPMYASKYEHIINFQSSFQLQPPSHIKEFIRNLFSNKKITAVYFTLDVSYKTSGLIAAHILHDAISKMNCFAQEIHPHGRLTFTPPVSQSQQQQSQQQKQQQKHIR